ncbi:MAG: 2-C-methyl-D-erythritol 4-phosphate cytidylyltransferase [Solirubrobacterales bacterium]|nr:2-C-methyl-D-erythritol 4-phosphate cytidylyltransferase [Solirubrobacterales bacterium]
MAVALIVAAGRGERLGASGPKAFVALAGRPLVAWSLTALAAVAAVERIVVAMPPGHALPDDAGAPAGTVLVAGGATRSHSVRAALAAAGPGGPVLVHDAARPLATPELFERALAALEDADAAVAAAPVTDTIKEAGPDLAVRRTLDRAALWAIQTPQAFRRAALVDALAQPDDVLAAATDDAWLVERTGGTVRVVKSSPENLKVTTRLDLRVAELLLRDRC